MEQSRARETRCLDSSHRHQGRTRKNIHFNHHVIKTLKAVYEKREEDHKKRGDKKTGPILTVVGKPISQKDPLKHSPATACDTVNIPYGAKAAKGVIFHDFRRAFKTNMARAGIDKEVRDTILGHNLPGMDDHYIKLNKNALHYTMEKLTQ